MRFRIHGPRAGTARAVRLYRGRLGPRNLRVQLGTNCTALPLEHDVPAIDVLAFPPDEVELERRRRIDELRSDEFERRSRIALFISVGMFAAWAADVGAVFAHGQSAATAVYGLLSVPLAVIIVVSLLYGRWALARSDQA